MDDVERVISYWVRVIQHLQLCYKVVLVDNGMQWDEAAGVQAEVDRLMEKWVASNPPEAML